MQLKVFSESKSWTVFDFDDNVKIVQGIEPPTDTIYHQIDRVPDSAPQPEGCEYLTFSWSRWDGGVGCVVTNCRAYLTNANGKTIDSFNV